MDATEARAKVRGLSGRLLVCGASFI
jgi:hypothetical protein